jgi:hypothetical protein
MAPGVFCEGLSLSLCQRFSVGGIATAVPVGGPETDNFLYWFILGVVASAVAIVLLGRLGRRESSLVESGTLEGGASAPPRSPHPLYDPNKVRPYGRAGAYITAHPVGAIIAVGVAVIVFVGIPEARLFILGSLSFGVLIGLVLWLRRR